MVFKTFEIILYLNNKKINNNWNKPAIGNVNARKDLFAYFL